MTALHGSKIGRLYRLRTPTEKDAMKTDMTAMSFDLTSLELQGALLVLSVIIVFAAFEIWKTR